MRTGRRRKLPVGLSVASVLGVLVVVVGWPAAAGAQQVSAGVSAVAARVEVLAKGQRAWQPVLIGGRISEGDDVRAFAGANAELRLPDGSSVVVAENSRFVVTKLDFDAENRMRAAVFHLAAGKLRVILTRGTAARVQARQNTVLMTTRPGIATVKGITLYGTYDPTLIKATFLVTEGGASVRAFCGDQTVELTAVELTTLTHATPCQPPTSPVRPSPQQLAQITGVTQPATPGTDAVLTAPSVTTVPVDVFVVNIPPAGALPVVVVTPPPPPPRAPEAVPLKSP